MAQVVQASRQGDEAAGGSQSALPAIVASAGDSEKDQTLPLSGWLRKLYFIFPVVLYVPDVIFNYYVYSDGVAPQNNLTIQIASVALWSFLSVGVVGMAYLLSVLAPWHWRQGHRMQAIFSGFGVFIATGITTWNSLSYRSSTPFRDFTTDKWVYSMWPQMQGISITMILVAVAPPFWALFWAVVQPLEANRNLRHLQESHVERMMRMEQEAELKRLKAETNAKVREAQLRGMAATAAAGRQQLASLLSQKGDEEGEQEQDAAAGAVVVEAASGQSSEAPNVLQLPTLAPTNTRELAGSRGGMNFFNHAAAATPGTHSAPAASARPMAQPALLADADVQGFGGMPGSDSVTFTSSRRPPTLGGLNTDVTELDGMTGTTGPRPAIRRTNELGSLARGMNGPSPRITQAIEEAFSELSANSKRVTEREHVALSAQKLGVDESAARSAVRSWRESKRTPRA